MTKKTYTVWTPEKIEEAERLYAKKTPIKQIGVIMDLPEHVIRARLQPKWTKPELKAFTQRMKEGATIETLVKEFKRSKRSVEMKYRYISNSGRTAPVAPRVESLDVLLAAGWSPHSERWIVQSQQKNNMISRVFRAI